MNQSTITKCIRPLHIEVQNLNSSPSQSTEPIGGRNNRGSILDDQHLPEHEDFSFT